MAKLTVPSRQMAVGVRDGFGSVVVAGPPENVSRGVEQPVSTRTLRATATAIWRMSPPGKRGTPRGCARGHEARDEDRLPRRRVCGPCRYAEDRAREDTPEGLAARRARLRTRIEACRVVLLERKRQPCMDCGGEFPPVAMHFDHRDWRQKRKGVSVWMSAGCLPQMLAEIELCDLVCANCHAIRGEQRRQGPEGHRGGRKRKYD